MKKVLITGSSRGIGAETARLFAKKGCHVYINYNKSEKSALALLGELKDYSVELVKADVSKSDEVKRMFSEIAGIDILVNNAGIAQTKLFTDITDDDWNNMISSVHYSAAKAGIIGLTKALAMEEGLSGITVNCIAPGVIKTDMTSNLSEEDFTALKDETPTNSIGTPFDVARTVLFLASDNSSFITGQVLGVNGGFVV